MWVAGQFDAVVQSNGSVLAAAGLARWVSGAWTVPGRLVGVGSQRPTGYALAVQGQSVVVGGDFADLTRPNGTAIGGGNVARWAYSGVWEPLAQDGAVYALATLPDGRLLAPGTVTTPDGTGATAVEVWDGAAWQPLGRGVTGIEVNALATDTAGGLLVGGRLGDGVDADGSPVASPGLVRWTGAAWERRSFGERRDLVLALARTGAETLAGGQFDAAGGTDDATVRAANVAALLPGGGRRPLSTLTGRDGITGGTHRVPLVVADSCGGAHVFADGSFTGGSAGPSPGGPVRTWDGEAWAAIQPGGFQAGGSHIAVSDRILYLSGGFETVVGVGSPGLAAFDPVIVAESAVPAERESGIAVAPNLSRGAATLTFHLDAAGPARLVLLDALGRTVAVLADGEQAAGEHTVRVDTSRLPAGVYVARLDAGGDVRAQRLTVVR